jgi:hypothetical protein
MNWWIKGYSYEFIGVWFSYFLGWMWIERTGTDAYLVPRYQLGREDAARPSQASMGIQSFFSHLLFARYAVRVAGGDSTGFPFETQNERHSL